MKILFILIILHLSLPAFSHGENCQESHQVDLTDLLAVTKELGWFGATEDNIKNAPCSRQKPFGEDEMKEWIAKNQTPLKMNRKINGIGFENETYENLEAFDHLTSRFDYWGKTSIMTFNSQCKKVECAVKEIFGDKEGTRLLFMYQKFGFNGSYLVNEESSPWKAHELDEVLLSLSDFPEEILPLAEDYPLHRFKRSGRKFEKPFKGTVANATITIFDLWNYLPEGERRYTIVHELGHVLGRKMERHPKWLKISGWKKLNSDDPFKGWEKKKTDQMISKYGETNAYEDLAESIAAYRYNAELLKSISPEKYDLIRQTIFDGVEYLSEKHCQNPSRMTDKIAENARKEFKKWKPSNEDLEIVAKACSEKIMIDLASNENFKFTDPYYGVCYEKALTQLAKRELIKFPFFHANKDLMDVVVRNIDLGAMEPQKKQSIISSVRETHKSLIKNTLTKSMVSLEAFGSSFTKKDLDSVDQYFQPDKLGVNASHVNKVYMQKVLLKLSSDLRKNRSSGRGPGSYFTKQEVEAQLGTLLE